MTEDQTKRLAELRAVTGRPLTDTEKAEVVQLEAAEREAHKAPVEAV